jgi:hypothetical protein
MFGNPEHTVKSQENNTGLTPYTGTQDMGLGLAGAGYGLRADKKTDLTAATNQMFGPMPSLDGTQQANTPTRNNDIKSLSDLFGYLGITFGEDHPMGPPSDLAGTGFEAPGSEQMGPPASAAPEAPAPAPSYDPYTSVPDYSGGGGGGYSPPSPGNFGLGWGGGWNSGGFGWDSSA